MKEWICPYCSKVAFNGENKLRHLAKHEPAISKMLRANLRLRLILLMEAQNEPRD